MSVFTGGGHLGAAMALEKYINKVDSTSKTLIVDVLDYVSPAVSKIVVKTYMSMLKWTPKLYGKMYNTSDANDCLIGENLNFFGSKVSALFSFKINRLVNKFNPDIVVCTHPFALQMVKNLGIPTIAILTDYDIHPLWIKECINAYIIPHEYLVDGVIEKGVERQKIYTFGIPVEDKFFDTFERKDILNEFGLKDKTTFLIMGGSLGLGKIEEIFLKLIESEKDFQMVVVTGSNKKLKNRLQKQLEYIRKDVVILDYTDKINKLMEVADFIITKPGGLTVAESLIKKLPICIISPIPGQEEKNTNFLVNCGVAIRLKEDYDIDSFLDEVMDDEIKLNNMREIAGILSKPNACRDIYNLMCELVLENNLNKRRCSY